MMVASSWSYATRLGCAYPRKPVKLVGPRVFWYRNVPFWVIIESSSGSGSQFVPPSVENSIRGPATPGKFDA